jgi:hypothetical protein
MTKHGLAEQGWTATGVVEAPLERVVEVLLVAEEGPIGKRNVPLLQAVPGAGRLLGRATLRGGPHEFVVLYGANPGGTVEVDRTEGYFAFQGGYKFRAEYRFTAHEKGTLLTYRAINVAPLEHRQRTAIRFQFWLAGKLKVGLRGGLRRIGTALACRTYPGS